MKRKICILTIILSSQSALAFDWGSIGNRLKNAGIKIGRNAENTAIPLAEAIGSIVADLVEKMAEATEPPQPTHALPDDF